VNKFEVQLLGLKLAKQFQEELDLDSKCPEYVFALRSEGVDSAEHLFKQVFVLHQHLPVFQCVEDLGVDPLHEVDQLDLFGCTHYQTFVH